MGPVKRRARASGIAACCRVGVKDADGAHFVSGVVEQLEFHLACGKPSDSDVAILYYQAFCSRLEI